MVPEDFENDEQLAIWLMEVWDEGRGRSKSNLELEVWSDSSSHGRHFDRFVQSTLGVSTTRPSKQTTRIDRLERQVRGLGAHPDGTDEAEWETSLRHARASCLEALRIWNDPTSSFRTGAFSLLFVTAWNALAIALLDQDGKKWWKTAKADDEEARRSLETQALVDLAFPGDGNEALRLNVAFWIKIRNAVAHRHMPAIDSPVIPWAQGGLLAFETVLDEQFGSEYCIGKSLSVPLQLSGFRDPGVLASRKKLQSSLPLDVQVLLAEAASAPDDILQDPRYMMRVAFVPFVPSSGRNPDAVAHFFKPGQVPTELDEALQRYVVLQKSSVGSRSNLTATQVFEEVERRTGFGFNSNLHAAAARHLGVRPNRGEQEKTLKIEYAEFHTAFKRWAYTQAWIDRLVDELKDSDPFEKVTGKPPKRLTDD